MLQQSVSPKKATQQAPICSLRIGDTCLRWMLPRLCLCMRYERYSHALIMVDGAESSPRMRGALYESDSRMPSGRIIPAYAGSTKIRTLLIPQQARSPLRYLRVGLMPPIRHLACSPSLFRFVAIYGSGDARFISCSSPLAALIFATQHKRLPPRKST